MAYSSSCSLARCSSLYDRLQPTATPIGLLWTLLSQCINSRRHYYVYTLQIAQQHLWIEA